MCTHRHMCTIHLMCVPQFPSVTSPARRTRVKWRQPFWGESPIPRAPAPCVCCAASAGIHAAAGTVAGHLSLQLLASTWLPPPGSLPGSPISSVRMGLWVVSLPSPAGREPLAGLCCAHVCGPNSKHHRGLAHSRVSVAQQMLRGFVENPRRSHLGDLS
jgi:hypothetical protein